MLEIHIHEIYIYTYSIHSFLIKLHSLHFKLAQKSNNIIQINE